MDPKSRVDIIIAKKVGDGNNKKAKISPPNPMFSTDYDQHIEGGLDPEKESHAEALIEAVKSHDAAGVISAFEGLMSCCGGEESEEESDEE